MTASQLGLELAQSAANASWHLRKLAEHGLVEPAGETKGRSRPWRVTAAGTGASVPGGVASEHVQQLLAKVLIDRDVARFVANRTHRHDDTWDDVQVANQAVLWLTAPEAQQLTADLLAVLYRYGHTVSAREQRPADARPVRVLTLSSVDPSS